MGISTISKRWPVPRGRPAESVSIPNGDKHDFKTDGIDIELGFGEMVSIPNGDKHDFKTFHENHSSQILYVSIPNGDKHDFKTSKWQKRHQDATSFNPQWG